MKFNFIGYSILFIGCHIIPCSSMQMLSSPSIESILNAPCLAEALLDFPDAIDDGTGEVYKSPTKRSKTTVIPDHLNDISAQWKAIGVAELDLIKMLIIQDSLYLEMQQQELPKVHNDKKTSKRTRDFDLDLLTPEKKGAYFELGGSAEDLKSEIMHVRDARVLPPILNLEKYPPKVYGQLWSPVAIGLPRGVIQTARSEGVIRTLFPDAHKAPVREETDEEKLERRKKEKAAFLKAEQNKGSAPEDLSAELKAEYKVWSAYLKHMNTIKDTEGSVLRKAGMISAFINLVSKHMDKTAIEGYEIYFITDSIDLLRTNADGVTNRILMKTGSCPIGADGEPMQVHHVNHYDYETHGKRCGSNCVVAFMSETMHQKESRGLHFKSKAIYKDFPADKPVDRVLFAKAREKIIQAVYKVVKKTK